MQPFPVRVVQQDLAVDTEKPYRFEFIIPITLPWLLDPSIPPPPYYPPDNEIVIHRKATNPILQALITSVTQEVLGPDTVISFLSEQWDGNVIPRNGVFDIATGHWKDQYGKEGYTINAYLQFGEDVNIISGFRFIVQYSTGDDDQNPPIVQFRASSELQDGKVLFHAEQYSERMKTYMNDTFAEDGVWP